jgi:hypothetical protein
MRYLEWPYGGRIVGWICLGNPPINGALKPSYSAILMACLKWRFAARNHPTELETLGVVGSVRFCDRLSRQVQPPDAENRMTGGVGEVMGAIPSPRPDPRCHP